MKKLFITTAMAALLAIGFTARADTVAATITVYTNASGGTTYVTNAASQTASGWQPILNIYDNLLNASNIAVAPFGLALTSGDKKGTWGAGILALYNVNNFVGVGIGMYYLGDWYEFNGSVQLQYPMPMTTNLVLTPFVVAGIGTSLSGANSNNGSVDVVSQIGANIDVVNIGKGWELGFGAFFGNITGAGAYSGNDVGGFLKLSRGI
jgi:hypothetical protein